LDTNTAVLVLEDGRVEPPLEAEEADTRVGIGDTRGICITGVVLSCFPVDNDRAPPTIDLDDGMSALPPFFNSPVIPPSIPLGLAPSEDWLGIDFPELKLA
jgi:hypothetical protein